MRSCDEIMGRRAITLKGICVVQSTVRIPEGERKREKAAH
jgi:hypothetical protein